MHDDFVAEFTVAFFGAGNDSDDNVGFWFRSNGNRDQYRLVIRKGQTPILQKSVDGRLSLIEVGDSTTPIDGFMHRCKLVANGDRIQCYLDGNLQIDAIDKSLQSGTQNEFSSFNASADIRLFRIVNIEGDRG